MSRRPDDDDIDPLLTLQPGDWTAGFYNFAELLARGTVRSRQDLRRLQADPDDPFPKPVLIGKSRAEFPRRLIWEWENRRVQAGPRQLLPREKAAHAARRRKPAGTTLPTTESQNDDDGGNQAAGRP